MVICTRFWTRMESILTCFLKSTRIGKWRFVIWIILITKTWNTLWNKVILVDLMKATLLTISLIMINTLSNKLSTTTKYIIRTSMYSIQARTSQIYLIQNKSSDQHILNLYQMYPTSINNPLIYKLQITHHQNLLFSL